MKLLSSVMKIFSGRLFPFRGKDIAMDLGTANTLIYLKGRGVVLNEPSFVAIERGKGELYAVGMEAKVMWGRSPKNIEVMRPIKDGVISDLEVTNMMIRAFINKVYQKLRIVKPRFVICIPSGITQVERRAVIDVALQCGAGKVFLIEEPMSAAIGSGLPVDEPRGCMVVDIGGGTTDVAIISMGGISASESARVAGDEMDEAIVDYVRKRHHILIGLLEAEEVKIQIGCVHPSEERTSYTVRGRDLATGSPREIELTEAEVAEAIEQPVEAVMETIRKVMDSSSPELVSDVARQGIFLTGGGALLRGLDSLIEEHMSVPVRVAEEPLFSVVKGAGRALEEFERFKKAFVA